MIIIRFIVVFCINLIFIGNSFGDTYKYYGVLRGNKTISYKSIFSGVVSLQANKEGVVYEDNSIYEIKSNEYLSKLDILNFQLNIEQLKLKRTLKDENLGKENLAKGFISRDEFESITDKKLEIELKIKEIKSDIKKIKELIDLSNPKIKSKYIVRHINIDDGQYVNNGDDIITIETLDKYHVDIKIDPTSITGNIKDKIITFKSLVNGTIGNANIEKIQKSNTHDSADGMKVLSLSIISDYDLAELLDTTFEIIIDD